MLLSDVPHSLHCTPLRLELAQSKGKQPSAAAATERSLLLSLSNKAVAFRRCRLILAAFTPWMRLVEQAR